MVLNLRDTCLSNEAFEQLTASEWPLLEELYLDDNPSVDAEGLPRVAADCQS